MQSHQSKFTYLHKCERKRTTTAVLHPHYTHKFLITILNVDRSGLDPEQNQICQICDADSNCIGLVFRSFYDVVKLEETHKT